jgi:hypothetical protein|tara:strand:+ start:1523 stop:1678 length:156 start_codon:yes stop_codon:yes gene_type:complete
MRFSAFFVRGGMVLQEGIAVDTLLIWFGRSATTLIFSKWQTNFGAEMFWPR